AEPRPLGRMIGSGEPVDCRHAEADDLGVIGKRIDDPQPLLDVVERRNSPHPLAEILLSGRRLQHQFVNALGKEMIERIDVTHVFNLLLWSGGGGRIVWQERCFVSSAWPRARTRSSAQKKRRQDTV